MSTIANYGQQPGAELIRVTTIIDPLQSRDHRVLANVFGIRGLAQTSERHRICGLKVALHQNAEGFGVPLPDASDEDCIAFSGWHGWAASRIRIRIGV